MDAIEILIDLARRPQLAAGQLRDALTPEVLNSHPHHDNSIAWLLWHAGREIDAQLTELSGTPSVLERAAFDERFGLGIPAREHGYGHSPARARAIYVADARILVEYLSAVVDAQLAYLATLEITDLGRIVDARWDPPVTLAARLISMSVDAAEHVAQAAYISGMGADAFENGP